MHFHVTCHKSNELKIAISAFHGIWSKPVEIFFLSLIWSQLCVEAQASEIRPGGHGGGMYRNSLKGLGSDVIASEGVHRESLGCLRIQAPSCGPCVRGVFPCISFQAAGHHLQEQSWAATTAKNTRTIICMPSIKRIITSTCWGERWQASILKQPLHQKY